MNEKGLVGVIFGGTGFIGASLLVILLSLRDLKKFIYLITSRSMKKIIF